MSPRPTAADLLALFGARTASKQGGKSPFTEQLLPRDDAASSLTSHDESLSTPPSPNLPQPRSETETVRAGLQDYISISSATSDDGSSVVEITPPPRIDPVSRRSQRDSTRTSSARVEAAQRKLPNASTSRIKDTAKPKPNESSAEDYFFIENRHLFLPLLPVKNHITRLMAQHNVPTRTSRSSATIIVPQALDTTQPRGITAVLKPYQLEGLAFFRSAHLQRASSVLGDEMGLGKTLQTLSFFQSLKEQAEPIQPPSPHLIVCPLSVLKTWTNEAVNFAPGLKLVKFHGSTSERTAAKAQLRDSSKSNSGIIDCVLTTYETVVSESSWLSRVRWTYVVLDEGHRIKNSKTEMAKACQKLKGHNKIMLTGTPIQNNLEELWSLLHWLYPQVFDDKSKDSFRAAFDLSRGDANMTFMQHCHALLQKIMLRRTKDSPGVNLNLAPKHEIYLHASLSHTQREWYRRLITRAGDDLVQDILHSSGTEKSVEGAANASSKSTWAKFNNLLMQLRMVTVHPYLISGAQPDPYVLGDHVVSTSSKFIILSKLVDDLVIAKRQKILIFSGFIDALNACEDMLHLKGGDGTVFKYCRFDGRTKTAQRSKALRLFNDSTEDYRVMLLSTRAGSLGLNLQAARSIVMLDQDFNPQVTLQAMARSHRIGQTEEVTVYNIICSGTVEEQILTRVHKKLYLATKVSGLPDNDVVDESTLTTSALRSILFWGTQALTDEFDPAEMLGWSAEDVVAKCKTKAPSAEDQTAVDEQAWVAKAERVKCAVLEGVELQRSQDHDVEVLEPLKREDRRRGKETTIMIDGFAVSKSSTECAWGEAVSTLAGKDPSLAEVKRERRPDFKHQTHCHNCKTNGSLLNCFWCPRAYHELCLSPLQTTSALMTWACPQHRCDTCKARTSDAGGMLYRCRECEAAYCDGCINWTATDERSESLEELEELGYAQRDEAFFLRCPRCRTKAGAASSPAPLESHAEVPKTPTTARSLTKTSATAGYAASVLPTEAETLPGTPYTSSTTRSQTPSLIDDMSPAGIQTPSSAASSLKRKFAEWTYEEPESPLKKKSIKQRENAKLSIRKSPQI